MTLAFRAGLFNIGAQGQLIIGALAAGYVGFTWNLPPGLHLLVALLAGILGGAVWGGIAGFLKARTGAHEVITTIMLNYLAAAVLLYRPEQERLPAPRQRQPAVAEGRRLARLFPSIVGNLHLGVIVALPGRGAGVVDPQTAAPSASRCARSAPTLGRAHRRHERAEGLHDGDGRSPAPWPGWPRP